MENYKKLKKGIKGCYNKGKKIYSKTLPGRKAISKRGRIIRNNIDDYFENSQIEMRKIARNYRY